MIIFGSRAVTYSTGHGEFYCQACRSRQPYAAKRVRRFFTLYFIPLIPLDVLQEFVQCKQCQGTFRNEALSYNPQVQQAKVTQTFELAVIQAMVYIAESSPALGRRPDDIVRVYREFFNSGPSEEELRQTIQQQTELGANSALRAIRTIGPELNDRGKEMIGKAAIMLLLQDRNLTPDIEAPLKSLAEAVGLSSAHLLGLLMEHKRANQARLGLVTPEE